ncbi:MAG: pilin, partial [Gammaproteobacteria bacterium]
STQYVDGLAYALSSTSVSTITIEFKDIGGSVVDASTDELMLTGTGSANGVAWECLTDSANPLEDRYKPANCR